MTASFAPRRANSTGHLRRLHEIDHKHPISRGLGCRHLIGRVRVEQDYLQERFTPDLDFASGPWKGPSQ